MLNDEFNQPHVPPFAFRSSFRVPCPSFLPLPAAGLSIVGLFILLHPARRVRRGEDPLASPADRRGLAPAGVRRRDAREARNGAAGAALFRASRASRRLTPA